MKLFLIFLVAMTSSALAYYNKMVYSRDALDENWRPEEMNSHEGLQKLLEVLRNENIDQTDITDESVSVTEPKSLEIKRFSSNTNDKKTKHGLGTHIMSRTGNNKKGKGVLVTLCLFKLCSFKTF